MTGTKWATERIEDGGTEGLGDEKMEGAQVETLHATSGPRAESKGRNGEE